MMLVPLFRLLNLSVPLMLANTVYSYFLPYMLISIPIYLIMRRELFNRKSIMGITLEGFKARLPLAIAIGFVIGGMEGFMLCPELAALGSKIDARLGMIILTLILAGFAEEFIFRSALQTALEKRLGSIRGLLVASMLFAIMHSSYGTWTEIMLGLGAGLAFGFLFQRTRSLPLVSLAHVISSVLLLFLPPLFMPYIALL